ncbi:MAG: HAD family hydrolase [Opitutaceae bacterium]|jgi:HAD superfamily hydrolase (TIGR01549 family)
MSVVGTRSSGRSAIRAVIFDLDGTLMDSMPLVMMAFAHALAPFRPDLDESAIFQRLGGPPAQTLLELIGDEAQATEALRRLESFGFENGASVQPFEGMRDLLQRLQSRGLSLAIWTGRDRHTTEAIFTAHDLAGFFSTVVCGDDLPTHKPHPAGMQVILSRLGVQSDEAIYAGDADADVLGGTEVGVRTVLIAHGREPEISIKARAANCVDTPEQAYAWIEAEVFSPAQ